MTTPSHRHAGYLEHDGDAVFATIHRPDPTDGHGPAVLICPPFGFEEICSYRALGVWADRLAAAGHLTLRVSYPGTGDSAGRPRDAGRLEAWTASIVVAVNHLRAAGATEVIALGLGLGGLLACRAAADGAALDGLALWSVPGRGRDLVRQLRAFHRLEWPPFFRDLPEPPPLPEGDLESAGFLLTAETVAALSALEVASLQIPVLGRGALVLGRDGVEPDARLLDALRAHDVVVRTAAGLGWTDLTADPQRIAFPEAVASELEMWLAPDRFGVDTTSGEHHKTGGKHDDEGDGRSDVDVDVDGERVAAQARLRTTAHLTVDGRPVTESLVRFDAGGVTLTGLLVGAGDRPAPVAALYLPSGGVRRIGPNRMWTEQARRSALQGLPTLRLDLEGIGDADGALAAFPEDGPLYDQRFLGQVRAAIDFVVRERVAEGVVLAGLCSGAYWSFYATIDDPRVLGSVLVNQRAIIFDDRLAARRDMRRLRTERLTWDLLRRNVTAERIAGVIRWLLASALPHRSPPPTAAGGDDAVFALTEAELLARLRASGKPVTIVFADHEPLEEELAAAGELERLALCPQIRIERIPVRDHTLRPVALQEQLLMMIDRALASWVPTQGTTAGPLGPDDELAPWPAKPHPPIAGAGLSGPEV